MVQKLARSSQPWSGSPGVGGSSALPVGSGAGVVHAPPGTICSLSAQLAFMPPTQAAVPHAMTRRSLPLTTVHTQSEWDELHPSVTYATNAKQ